MKKEVIKAKENEKKNKLPLIIGVIVLIIVVGIIGFIILNQNNNSIKGQFDKILSSSKTEVIFFERKGNFESDEFKELLDTDLKEQGITYTTIDLTNASYDDIEYIKEKLNLSNGEFDVYIAVIKGSENLIMINYNDYDRTMFFFANKGLLKDSTLILNEYYYKLGKEALDNGFLGEAKRNFDNCLEYLDTKELLNDKRFLLLDSDYGHRIENISLNGYNLIFTFKYSGGYSSDILSISKFECRGAYACLAAETEFTSYDAKVIGNIIYLKEKGSTDYNQYYTIEKITNDTLKIKEISWNLKKNY